MRITPKVTRVRGEVLYKHTRARVAAGLPPAIAGYRYFAVLEDGCDEVILIKATRRYAWAYQWGHTVATGKSGLAAYFSYGDSAEGPSSWDATEEFRIEWA
jgi:hypothetical protein